MPRFHQLMGVSVRSPAQLRLRLRLPCVTDYTCHRRGWIMRRLATWIAALLLFAAPELAVAQRGGHGAGGKTRLRSRQLKNRDLSFSPGVTRLIEPTKRTEGGN